MHNVNTYLLMGIIGDINGRPSRLIDFSRLDNFVSDMFELDVDTVNCFDKTNVLDNLNIEQSKKAMHLLLIRANNLDLPT